MKICNKCNVEKPLTEFFKDNRNLTDGRYSICKVCKTVGTMKWRGSNREKYNKSQSAYMRGMDKDKRYGSEIKRRYGCTLEQYNAMLVSQEGACAICKVLPNPAEKKGRLYVDHCHETGKVRALLCKHCNSMLGYAKDDTRIMLEAVAYIIRHKKP